MGNAEARESLGPADTTRYSLTTTSGTIPANARTEPGRLQRLGGRRMICDAPLNIPARLEEIMGFRSRPWRRPLPFTIANGLRSIAFGGCQPNLWCRPGTPFHQSLGGRR